MGQVRVEKTNKPSVLELTGSFMETVLGRKMHTVLKNLHWLEMKRVGGEVG